MCSLSFTQPHFQGCSSGRLLSAQSTYALNTLKSYPTQLPYVGKSILPSVWQTVASLTVLLQYEPVLNWFITVWTSVIIAKLVLPDGRNANWSEKLLNTGMENEDGIKMETVYRTVPASHISASWLNLTNVNLTFRGGALAKPRYNDNNNISFSRSQYTW